ncbi:MAG: hypothetical protein M9932_04105 [Xanthobacteraceae bacterium]|nr:hypothetical protein [Xanthobacteraceae bacterium]
MIGPIARILVRYIAGYLALKALLPQSVADMVANDPDVAAVVGCVLMALVEGSYMLAKRHGWRT